MPLIAAFLLVAATVAVHAAGLSLLLRQFHRQPGGFPLRYWRVTWLLVRVVWMLLLIHVAEIVIWGLYYVSSGCLPDLESAFYFSGVTYTTLGFGDILLDPPWRILAPVEALTGILMCGLSTAFFFAELGGLLGRKRSL